MNRFTDWYEDHTVFFWVTLAVIFVGFWVCYFIFIWEQPIKEGVVINKIHDPEHVKYYEDRKSVETLETYYDYQSETNKTRWVHDHYEYCVDKHFDGEDWVIVIEAPSKKHKGKYLTNEIYVTQYRYENVKMESYFIMNEEYGDSGQDTNNEVTQVTNWQRWDSNVEDYKSLEY
jgi:hypothetical protein